MSESQQKQHIFRLHINPKNPVGKKLFPMLVHPLESIVALRRLSDLYNSAAHVQDCVGFVDALFSSLNVHFDITDADTARIPKQGPVVVVANHPFGGIEGLAIIRMMCSVRPDVKVMANPLLARIPQLRERWVYIDPFGTTSGAEANVRGVREAIRWVKNGGMLVVFPAGEVSHLDLRKMHVTDPVWNKSVAAILRHTGAPALPVFFEGHNGVLFQMLGLAHPLLRTAMLPRELLNKRGRIIRVSVGAPIPTSMFANCADDAAIMDTLRERTYLLGARERHSKAGRRAHHRPQKEQALEPVVPAEDPEALDAEVKALPPAQQLMESGEFRVCIAEAAQIPHMLREIGRLREITFRGVGEGTGKSIDLDEFDAYYLHLFVWNQEKKELLGAYRLGKADEIVARYGTRGLYTATLFEFRKELFQQMGPALEMGRSFIRAEYQRSYAGLLLLWRGIGAFVCANPQYKTLFGPVSISNTYQQFSRQLIVSYLGRNETHPLSRYVKPRNPFRPGFRSRSRGLVTSTLQDIDDVSTLISYIEGDQKGVPVLLKNYLKLGAELLGFNVDHDFSDVLDGLVLVDLTRTDPKMLERYIGPGAPGLLAYHGVKPTV